MHDKKVGHVTSSNRTIETQNTATSQIQ